MLGTLNSIPGTSGWVGQEQTGTGWMNREGLQGTASPRQGFSFLLTQNPPSLSSRVWHASRQGRDRHLSGQGQAAYEKEPSNKRKRGPAHSPGRDSPSM